MTGLLSDKEKRLLLESLIRNNITSVPSLREKGISQPAINRYRMIILRKLKREKHLSQ